MSPMVYSQLWRAERQPTPRQRRMADERLSQLAADVSHISHETALLVSTLKARVKGPRGQPRFGEGCRGPLPSGAAHLVLGPVSSNVSALSLHARRGRKRDEDTKAC